MQLGTIRTERVICRRRWSRACISGTSLGRVVPSKNGFSSLFSSVWALFFVFFSGDFDGRRRFGLCWDRDGRGVRSTIGRQLAASKDDKVSETEAHSQEHCRATRYLLLFLMVLGTWTVSMGLAMQELLARCGRWARPC